MKSDRTIKLDIGQSEVETDVPYTTTVHSISYTNKHKGIMKDIPSKLSWDYYLETWISLVIYEITFLGCMLAIARGGGLQWSLLGAYGFFGVFSVGHEAIHGAAAHTPALNAVMGWIAMDVILISTSTWKYRHHALHHKWVKFPEDIQVLTGNYVPSEIYNTISEVVAPHWKDDVHYMYLNLWEDKPHSVGVVLRFLWIGCFVYYKPLHFLVMLIGFVTLANYLVLVTHAIEIQIKTTDYLLHQVRNSWDIFPHSRLAGFVFCGFNTHLTHHALPKLPRSMMSIGSKAMEKEFGDVYRVRVINSLGDLYHLLRYRHTNMADTISLRQHVDMLRTKCKKG